MKHYIEAWQLTHYMYVTTMYLYLIFFFFSDLSIFYRASGFQRQLRIYGKGDKVGAMSPVEMPPLTWRLIAVKVACASGGP